MSLLQVSDLSVGVRTRDGIRPIVSEVTFSLREGESLALIGESGCGKTTTLRAVLGLFPQSVVPVAGRVEFGSQDLLSLSRRQLRTIRGNRIAVIWQDPGSSLDPVMRVGDQIVETIRAHETVSRRAAAARAAELMAKVELPDVGRLFRAFPHELSGGQRQRIGIAAAISMNPAVLLADEPTTALDVTVQATVLDLLAALRAELGLAMLLVSHDIAVVANTCDSIAVMYAGRIVESGPTSQVLRQPSHQYTAGLIASAPDIEQVGRRPRGIAGMPPAGSAATACSFAPRCPAVSSRCRSELPVLTRTPAAGADGGLAHAVACFHPAGSEHAA
jgi:oligopeptide/dipeptide ABC transporter ATP-binding protein